MSGAELIARLHLPWPKDGSGDEVTLPIWVLELTAEAADRIEALTKERDTAREYAGEVRIREKVADDARIEAEAKLAKAVEAAFQEGFLAGTADGWVNNPRIKMEWKRSRARTTIAEIKGESQDGK